METRFEKFDHGGKLRVFAWRLIVNDNVYDTYDDKPLTLVPFGIVHVVVTLSL